MRRPLIVIILIFCHIKAPAQLLDLDFNHKKVKDFIEAEIHVGSKQFTPEETFLVQPAIAQPVAFSTHQDSLPDLLSYCFYNKTDSGITSLNYVWRKAYTDNDAWPPQKINLLVNKYKELLLQLTDRYGASISTGSLDSLSKMDNGFFEKRDQWPLAGNITIDLYMTLNNKHIDLGNGTSITPTYTIDLTIDHNSKAAGDFPGNIPVAKADSLFFEFVTCITAKKYDKARKLLSEQNRKNTTDEQLKTIAVNLANERLELFTSGVQFTDDGSPYLMLQYKYRSDKSQPPAKLIKVLFNNDDYIVTVQSFSK
jgi:hypothetical protein